MKTSRSTILFASIVASWATMGCSKGSDTEVASPREKTAQIVGVGDEQQAANLALRLNEEASKGKPTQVTVHARYALALACPLCAPIILANASGSPTQGSYLLPVVAAGEANPADYAIVGEFRLVGHYSGTLTPLKEWMHERGSTPPSANAGDAHLRAPYLTFIVDRWCYVPPSELPLLEGQADEDDFSRRMVKLIHELRDDGRFCK